MNIQNEITTELERLMAFRPVTGETARIGSLLDYVEGSIKAAGLKIERGVSGGHSYLLAGTRSTRKSQVLLQAHVDVVPASDELFKLTADKGKLSGRGAYDMLFATAAYLVLIRELAENSSLDKLDLGIMLTSDEEIGGFNGVGKLSKDYDCQVCFLPDAGTLTEACIASKGVLQLVVTSMGVAGHSSRPANFQNPIVPLAVFVGDIEELYPNTDITQTTCAITRFNSGEADNQVPGIGKLTLDIRFNPADDPEQITKKISQAASFHGLSLETLASEGAFQTDTNHPKFLEFIDTYKAVTSNDLDLIIEPGSSDARFFALKGIPVIMIRPTGGGLHGDQEWIDRGSLVVFYEVLKAYVSARNLTQAPQYSSLVK